MKNSHLKVHKVEATGNDFIMIFSQDWSAFKNQYQRRHIEPQQFVQKLCDRHFGLGADGLVILHPLHTEAYTTLRWEFYNSDGSRALMCGNATRAAARCVQNLSNVSELTIQTDIGEVKTKILNNNLVSSFIPFARTDPSLKVSVESVAIRELHYQRGIQAESPKDKTTPTATAWIVNTGVPHSVVIFQDQDLSFMNGGSLLDLEIEKIFRDDIQALRFHPVHGPEGSNVTFVRQSPKGIESITFERGVEGCTLSCGTGVLAAALVVRDRAISALSSSAAEVIDIHTRGGQLSVRFYPASVSQNGQQQIELIGPARYICESNISGDYIYE